MKSVQHNIFFVTRFFLFFLWCNASLFSSWELSEKLRMYWTGLISDQCFYSENIDLLNGSIGDDEVAYILTTCDFFLNVDYGDKKHPRVKLYSDIRFQFAWGSNADVMVLPNSLTLEKVNLLITPSRLNKHLIWGREMWAKFALSENVKEHNHYLQLGLIPYEIGRAISLGAAYETVGFLGFTPTYSIDQFAPAMVLSFNPKPSTIINFYVAMIESEQDSLDGVLEQIHTMEINTCAPRGVDANSFIAEFMLEQHLKIKKIIQ